MKLLRTSDGSTEPVTLSQANDQLRRDSSDDDTYVTRLITAARQQFEEDTRYIVTDSQTWELHLDKFPNEEILLPLRPLLTVTSVQYYDEDDAQQTWNSSNYYTDLVSTKGRVVYKDSTSYPDTIPGRPNAVTVTFTAGLSTPSTDCPEDIRQAILLLVSHFYENRQAVAGGISLAPLPMGYERIIERYRLYGIEEK